MSSETTPTGVRAADLAIGQSFKRGSPDSRGYTLYRIEPEYGHADPRPGYILAYNAHANYVVHDVREEEVVYPVTDSNRTDW